MTKAQIRREQNLRNIRWLRAMYEALQKRRAMSLLPRLVP